MKLIELMYADDDREDLEMFTEAVNNLIEKKLARINLRVFSSGEGIMAALENKAENCIVFLDINMPGKNGFQVLKEIRGNKNLRLLPVVIFSTSNNKTSMDISYELGASLYIIKPNSFFDLLNIIEKVVTMDWQATTASGAFLLNPDS